MKVNYNIGVNQDNQKFIDTISDSKLKKYLEFRYTNSFKTEIEKFKDSQEQINRDSRFQEIENRRVERKDRRR